MGEFKSDLCLSNRAPAVAPSIQRKCCVFTGAPAPSPASSYPHFCSSDPVTLLAPRRQVPSLFTPGLCTTLLWTWGSFPTGISGLTPSLHSDLCANVTFSVTPHWPPLCPRYPLSITNLHLPCLTPYVSIARSNRHHDLLFITFLGQGFLSSVH